MSTYLRAFVIALCLTTPGAFTLAQTPTGEDAQIVSRFATSRGTSTTNFDVESFDLNGIFGLLARDDLNRAIELAKNFTGEAPRATATLAIVRTSLDQKRNERYLSFSSSFRIHHSSLAFTPVQAKV